MERITVPFFLPVSSSNSLSCQGTFTLLMPLFFCETFFLYETLKPVSAILYQIFIFSHDSPLKTMKHVFYFI